MEALFKEGDEVAEGDVMLVFDKAPFEAAMHEADANLSRNTALARDAEIAAERLEGAMASQAASTRELEIAQAVARAARGAAAASAAELEKARVELAYCEIRAPITGRTGTLMTKPGNIVEENKTALVEIRQISPILVGFSVPEQRLNEVKERQARGPLPVEVHVPGKSEPERGRLTFIDNTVDPTTGTVRMRATFENKDRALWPGLYLDVVLTTEVQKGVVVVPSSAVQPSQKGMAVFVVKPGQVVEDRIVTVNRTQGGKSVISAGLNAGDVVVTDGQLRLVPGAKVEFKAPALTEAVTDKGSGAP
jgi:multidrug efflux system membrane fusion protein